MLMPSNNHRLQNREQQEGVTMFCPKCGAKNDDTAKFCNACGAPLQSNVPAANNGNDSSAQSAPSSTENIESSTSFIAKHRIKLIVGAAVVAVAVVGVVLFNILGAGTPPQGTFLFGSWNGFHITGDEIQITMTSMNCKNEEEVLSGTLVKTGSYDGGTTWRVEDSNYDEYGEVYLKIPDGAQDGDIEGTWIITGVWPDSDDGETRYQTQLYQFNADGTLYKDYVNGTNPAANVIENKTSHDELEQLHEQQSANHTEGYSITMETADWWKNEDGTYSFGIKDNYTNYSAVIEPLE